MQVPSVHQICWIVEDILPSSLHACRYTVIDVTNNHNRIRHMHEKGQVTNIQSSPNLLVFYDPTEGCLSFNTRAFPIKAWLIRA